MDENAVLSMRGIGKSFPGVRALHSVDFTLRRGQIHALMGENGAGKSTLIKVLTGVEEFAEGQIFLEGFEGPVVNTSPQEAQARGISTVYQEVNLCPNLTVAENIYVGRQPKRAGLVDWKAMNRRATELLGRLNMHIDVTKNLENYSVAVQQMVAIARAIDISAKVLILDEPTSSLDEGEVKKLFEVMRQLRGENLGIVFVTHFLEQVYEVCDQITVLRNGELVGEYAVESLPRVQLVAKMMGKEYDDLAALKSDEGADEKRGDKTPAISCRGLGRTGSIQPFDLDIAKGEVIGLTGLLGSGRSELMRVIYGADKPTCGTLEVNGKPVRVRSPKDAMKAGMAYLPENRKEEGIIADLSVRENLMIALQSHRGALRLIGRKEQETLANRYIELLQIKTAGLETPVSQLSGGNQQKVILGRWLLTQPDFLILDEPTRGIDVGTKTEIQKLVLKLAGEGMTIAFISSEIDEMLRTVSRLAVLRDRRKVGELSREELNQNTVMAAIAGGGSDG